MMVKENYELETVAQFLESNLKETIANLASLKGGMFSVAYAFETSKGSFIIRINQWLEDFKKDLYVYNRFKNTPIPLPKIAEIGKFKDNSYFCVSYKCPGKILNKFSVLEKMSQLPSLFNHLNHIHALDTSSQQGYGLMDAEGRGQFSSWHEALLDRGNRKMDYNWEKLWNHSFLDKKIYDFYRKKMKILMQKCPNSSAFIHGDFGYDNVLGEGRIITGIIDWAESRLGDPLYDIAYLNFWSEEIDYKKEYALFAAQKGLSYEYYEERIQCYSLYIGLHSLIISAYLQDYQDYLSVLRRIKRSIGEEAFS